MKQNILQTTNPFTIPHILWNIARVVLACGISFLFFVGISMLHAMIGLGGKHETKTQAQKPVLMEVVRKPPEEQKKVTQQLRQVQQTSNSNRSLGNQMSMRFSPDLGIDNGAAGNGDAVVVQSQELQAEIFEEGQTDEKPIPTQITPIPYPERAREMGVEGKLVVTFVVGYDGKVKFIEVQKSPSPIITNEAKRAIATWRFKPAKKNGVPVNIRVRQEIDFKVE